MTRLFYQTKKKVLNADAFSAAKVTLDAFADFDGPETEVFVRRARVGGKLYVDLCNDKWEVVEVDADGWRIIPDSPVNFIRSNNMLALPIPVNIPPKEGKEKLRKLTRFKDESGIVIMFAGLIDSLGGEGPHSVIIITGPPGAPFFMFQTLFRPRRWPSAAGLASRPSDSADDLDNLRCRRARVPSPWRSMMMRFAGFTLREMISGISSRNTPRLVSLDLKRAFSRAMASPCFR